MRSGSKKTGGRRRAPGLCRPLRFGKGRACYLASRFEAPFYDGLYQAAAHEAGLTSCRPAALPEGVLAARRGELLFFAELPLHAGAAALGL